MPPHRHLINVASFPLHKGISLNVVRGSVVYFGLHDVIDHFKQKPQRPPSNSKAKNLNNATSQIHGAKDDDESVVGGGGEDKNLNSSDGGQIPPPSSNTPAVEVKEKILAIVNAANERCLVRPRRPLPISLSLC